MFEMALKDTVHIGIFCPDAKIRGQRYELFFKERYFSPPLTLFTFY